MAKGNDIFYESYYKPFNDNFLHRMYSVSKTFIAVAVGMAVTKGLMRLDDVIVQVIDTYFGCLNIHISFKDNYATLSFVRSGQYIFEGIDGYVIGKANKGE